MLKDFCQYLYKRHERIWRRSKWDNRKEVGGGETLHVPMSSAASGGYTESDLIVLIFFFFFFCLLLSSHLQPKRPECSSSPFFSSYRTATTATVPTHFSQGTLIS